MSGEDTAEVSNEIDSLLQPLPAWPVSGLQYDEPAARSHVGTGQHGAARLVSAEDVDESTCSARSQQRNRIGSTATRPAEHKVEREGSIIVPSACQVAGADCLVHAPTPPCVGGMRFSDRNRMPEPGDCRLSKDLQTTIWGDRESRRSTRRHRHDAPASGFKVWCKTDGVRAGSLN